MKRCVYVIATAAFALGTGMPSAGRAQTPEAAASASVAASNRAGFDRTLTLQGITFRVRSTNAGSLNRLRIEPQGLKGKGANAVVEKGLC